MKVNVKGKGSVQLSRSDFVAGGGQGDVYAKGSIAYKIYHDPKQMLPVGKISELSQLTDPNIIRPQNLILDDRNKVIGYTMRYVSDADPLARMFTKAYRNRNGIKPEQVNSMVMGLKRLVEHVHSKKIIIVDLNELNFLVSKDLGNVYGIDCDAFQTPSYAATAIMDSIRDRHMTGHDFHEGTDWFSFAIVSFQAFVGIHPFKGKHDGYKGMTSIEAMDARMKDSISVLHPDVRVPKAALPFDLIPGNWRGWYEQVFHQNARIAPPANFSDIAVIVPVVKTVSGNAIIIDQFFETTSDIAALFDSGTNWGAISADRIFDKTRATGTPPKGSGLSLVFTPKGDKPLVSYMAGSEVKIWDPVMKVEIATLPGNGTMTSENRLYIRNKGQISQVVFNEVGSQIIVTTATVANVLPMATKLFDGCAYQDMLGSSFWSMFPGDRMHYQCRIKELEGKRIIDAKYDGGVLVVLSSEAGRYDLHIFRFDASHTAYDSRTEKDTQYPEVNFVTLDSGVVVRLAEDGKLELFASKKDNPNIKKVEDKSITSDMTLCKKGGRLAAIRGNRAYTLKMK